VNALRAAVPACDVRPFLEPGDAARRLSRGVPCLADGEWHIEAASSERLEVRGDGRLDLTVALRLRHARSGRLDSRPAFVELTAPEGPPGRAVEADLGPFGPASRLTGRDASTGARLWLSPADPRIPHAFEVLQGETSCIDGSDGSWNVRVLAHRFGRRLCCRLTRGEGREADLILKVHAGRVDRRPAAFLRSVASRTESFRVPRVVLEDPSSRFVLLERVPGASVHERMLRGEPWAARDVGRAVRALQSVPPTGLPRHGLGEEHATVRKLAARAAVVEPGLAAGIVLRLGQHTGRLADDAALVSSHRDLHDKQVLCEDATLSIIDWDLVSAAPAPLDPANFLAHLRLRALQGRISHARARAERAAFVDGYGPSCPAWERIALLRLAAVYALRPAWPGLAERLVEAAGHGKETP
jgi:tRNA A-37 threonylcarbamoyl transferase component Bud32